MKKTIVLITVLLIQANIVYAEKSLRPIKSQDVKVTYDDFNKYYIHMLPKVVGRNSDWQITKINLFFYSSQNNEILTTGIIGTHHSSSGHLFLYAQDKFDGKFDISKQDVNFHSCDQYGCQANSYFGFQLPIDYWINKDSEIDFRLTSNNSSITFSVPEEVLDNMKALLKDVTHSTQPLPIPVPDELLAR